MLSPAHKEVALVYTVVCAITFGITRLRDVPFVGDYVPLAVGALFLLTAMKMAQREPDGMRRFGIDLNGVLAPRDDEREVGPLGLGGLAKAVMRSVPSALRETLIAIVIVLLIFPPFAVGFWWWMDPPHGFQLALRDDFLSFSIAQILVVGLPEEALFRGYVQTRLDDAHPNKRRVFGIELSVQSLVIQALLFGFIHLLVDGDPLRMSVAIPGLLFGWLRSWRGGIGASIALHAISNIYSDVLVSGWLH